MAVSPSRQTSKQGRSIVVTRHQQSDIDQAAADWHTLVLGGEIDWDAFAAWLDAAPDHQPAYDRIASLDAEVANFARAHGMPSDEDDTQEFRVTAGNDDEGPGRRTPYRWWLGGVVAASVCALVFVLPGLSGSPDVKPVLYATADGQRTVELAGSGTVRLDARSQIAIAADGHVKMEHGAAWFELRHNEDRPVEIRSGSFIVRDIGTRFTVSRSAGRLHVAVADGIVDVGFDGSGNNGSPVRLRAGQTLEGDERTGTMEVGTIAPEAVGSWREGRLVYDNAPLTRVADDLSRYLGKPVEVSPAIASLRLSGILLIRNGPDLVDQICAILPVEAVRSDGHIRLVPRARR